MLALVTYSVSTIHGWIVLYCIRRGLLFYYLYTGYSRCLQFDNKQQARVFLCPFIIIRGELLSSS